MDTDVLVVGAGPTGLFLAAQLARFGVSLTIIDREDGPSVHSKALGVHARTLEAFATRQYADAFINQGLPIQLARIYAGGTERAQLPLEEIDSAYSFILSLPQSETERLLIDQLHSSGEDVHWKTELLELSRDEKGVTATLDAGDSTKDLRARWVVGCDGAHSRVRQEAGIDWSGEDIDAPFALTDARIDSTLIDDEAFQVFLLEDSRIILFVPLPDGRQRVICTLSPSSENTEVDRSFFQHHLTSHIDEDLTFREIDWVSSFSVRQRVAKTFRRDRILLAGDAGHAHSPVGGQGMNTGLQDAHNLAWKLAAHLHGTAQETLIDTYDEERRPIAERVVWLTGLGTRFARQMPGWMRSLRNAALTLLPKIRPLRSRLLGAVSQVRINYDQGPLTLNAFDQQVGTLRAGRFAPNLEGPDGSDLYSRLAGSRPVAVLASTSSPPAPLSEAPLPVLQVSPSTLNAHGGSHDLLLIVRPDGYIGYTGSVDAEDSVSSYLAHHLQWTLTLEESSSMNGDKNIP